MGPNAACLTANKNRIAYEVTEQKWQSEKLEETNTLDGTSASSPKVVAPICVRRSKFSIVTTPWFSAIYFSKSWVLVLEAWYGVIWKKLQRRLVVADWRCVTFGESVFGHLAGVTVANLCYKITFESLFCVNFNNSVCCYQTCVRIPLVWLTYFLNLDLMLSFSLLITRS